MHHKGSFSIFLFILGFYLTQCQQNADRIHISAEEFLSLGDTTNAMILDVRTDSEYRSGHLDNALLINIHSPEFLNEIEGLDKDQTYYVYCHSGIRSRRAVKMMRKQGFIHSYNIKGGIIQLSRQGATLVK